MIEKTIEKPQTEHIPQKKTHREFLILILVLMIGLFAFNSVWQSEMPQTIGREWNNFLNFLKSQKNKITQSAVVPSSSQKVKYQIVSEESQVIDVAKKSSPAVVSIVASTDVPKLEVCYQEESFSDPMFNDLFNFR